MSTADNMYRSDSICKSDGG